MEKLYIWLTPIWVLSVGVTIGAAALLALWALLYLVRRPAADAMASAVHEGVLQPIGYVVAAMAALAIFAAPTMPVSAVMESLGRLTAVGPKVVQVTVPANSEDFPVPLVFRGEELQEYVIDSDEDVAVNTEEGKGYVDPLVLVEGGDQYRWTPGSPTPRGFDEDVTTLYVTNETASDSDFTFLAETDVKTPQARQIPIAAVSVIGLFGIYFLIRWLAPRVSVIAAATAKETISQPLFALLTGLGVVALVAYVFIPYNTFGEDVKMLKTSGMTTIKVLAIIMALWTASTSVADEIEGRTALTVLSKPVGRRQFIIGKFLGIIWPIVLMFVVLGVVFLACVSFKVVYDARESSKTMPVWTECHTEVVRIIPGLVLAFFESVVLAAISVAVSTRLPMLPNLIICGSIYVLGHLAALIVKSQSALNEIVFVRFFGRLVSTILPVLDHFEIEGAIAGESTVPMAYLGWALLYTALYCGVAMLLALLLFEDRDLA
ncbi:MAG: ABC transporter permease subunit [Planctomycetales bacterium]|nr:ABC transporter permease subunit [Planctomycetales bacterium]